MLTREALQNDALSESSVQSYKALYDCNLHLEAVINTHKTIGHRCGQRAPR